MRIDADELKKRLDIVAIIGGYTKLEQAGHEFKGLCPFHSEKTPSFYVNPDKGMYKCHGCGVGGDAIKFVQEKEGLSFKDAIERLAGAPAPKKSDRPRRSKKTIKVWPRLPKSEALHEYKDASGILRLVVCRRPKLKAKEGEKPPTPKVMPFVPVDGGFVPKNLPDGRPVYRLPEMLAAGTAKQVLIVEGENTADALAALGFVAISWCGGCNAIEKTDWSVLSGRKVCIVADDDDAGRKASKWLAWHLSSIAAKVQLRTPMGQTKRDIADHDEAMLSKDAAIQFIRDLPQSDPPEHDPNQPPPMPAADDEPPPETPDGGGEFFDNPKFKNLGLIDSNTIAFFIKKTSQIHTVRAPDLYAPKHLKTICPSSTFWEGLAGGDLRSADNLHTVADGLLSAAQSMPLYAFEDQIHRGAFKDSAGKVWWHLGDRLIDPGGKRRRLHEAPDGQLAIQAKRLKTEPNAGGNAKALLDAIRGYWWQYAAHGDLFTGWLLASIVSGALSWRAHCWLIAPAGSGKSWLLSEVVYPLMQQLDARRHDSGLSTPAAVRRQIGSDRLPFVIEEARGTNKSASDQFEKIVPLIRLSSDGREAISLAQAGSSQAVVRFQPAAAFLLCSNISQILGEQDASRITFLRLAKQPAAPERRAISKRIEQELSNPAEMTAGIMAAAPAICEAVEFAKRVLSETKSVSGREASQLGTLVGAACWAAGTVDAAAVTNLAAGVLKIRNTEENKTLAERVFEEILSIELRIDQGDTLTVGAVLRDEAFSMTAERKARELGIALKGVFIGIRTDAPQLKNALKHNWEGVHLGEVLRGLPGATTTTKLWTLGQKRCRPLLLPKEILNDE